MNNLKRVLGLGLVGTMLAGMLTMGASAAEFTDVEKIQHDEAVNVLVALKVIDGKPDGSFDPEGNVTRAEMAKMIAVAMNGGNEANTGVKTDPSFTDIGGHWAESYIEYCHDLGIISGRGDGTFDPGANVTGLEATKMVLSAMGFDAEAYKLTGASWAVRTDEVARTMTGTKGGEPNMYEDLATVMMAANASRDTAAQLIWNGLQNRTRTVQPTTTTGGGVEWTYVTNTTTLLEQRYSATTQEYTFEGNYDTDAASEEGFISMGDGIEFPYDFDIDNIGEEVKVIWRDGKGGSDGKPDKHDTIFGVFNTGKTQVYHVLKNELQDAEDKNNKKVKFGGTKYDTTGTSIEVTYNYMVKANPETVNVADINSSSGWRTQSPDRIKFVCDEDGKIEAAYVTTVAAGRVTSVTGSKITVNGLGTVDIADNDVEEGLKKDDVVIFTKIYDTKVSDAFVTITKAETVEGEIDGFKGSGTDGAYDNIVLDGTTYKVAGKKLTSVTADNAYTKVATDDEVRLYLCDGLVVAAEALSEAGGKYALIVDKDNGTVGSALSGLKLIVMTPDGVEHTVTVDKNSTKNDKDEKLTQANEVKIGDLVEYSTLSNGTIKIKTLAKDTGSKNGVTTEVATDGDIWDKDSKKLQVKVNATTGFVATSSAPLFVSVKGKGADKVDANADFYVYTLRDLGNIENKTGGEVTIQAYLDGSEIVAAAVELKNKPTSNTADTMYGMVKSVEGTRKAPNGDDKTLYKVIVEGEIIDVYYEADALAKGNLVTFDRTTNDVYDDGVIDVIVDVNDSTIEGWTLAAIVDNDSDLLKYYETTVAAEGATAENPSYTGTQVSTAFDKDVKVIYVDGDEYAVGDEVGYKVFDPANGYANAVFHVDAGKIDVIIVETSGEANLAVKGDKKDNGTDDFGPAIAATPAEKVTLVNKNATIAAVANKTGAYTVGLSATEVEVGKTFTVTVKCSSVDSNNASGEVVTVTYNSEDKTVEFTGADSTGKTVTFTAVKDVTEVTAAVAAKQ